MRYLTTALVSEGVTDDQFLPRLLGRALTELCLTEFVDQVDVADVQVLRDRKGPCSVPDVIKLVERNAGSFTIVFFHHDQGANPGRVAGEWLEPLRDAWGARRERLVTVVPVRETEAWLLSRSTPDHYSQLGELANLDRLGMVPAYQRWRVQTRDALAEIGFRPC